MAFKASNLTKLANLLGLNSSTDITPGFYIYQAGADTLATVAAADYFDAIAGQVSIGSLIWAMTSKGAHVLKVSAVTSSTVTVVHQGDAIDSARGQAVTVTASDTIDTGLGVALGGVVATEDSDPADNPEWVSASIGDQAGAPAAGHFLLKTWANTSGTDPTPTAATTFGKKVNWYAWI